MASNFKFLETEFPVLTNFGNLAERIITQIRTRA